MSGPTRRGARPQVVDRSVQQTPRALASNVTLTASSDRTASTVSSRTWHPVNHTSSAASDSANAKTRPDTGWRVSTTRNSRHTCRLTSIGRASATRASTKLEAALCAGCASTVAATIRLGIQEERIGDRFSGHRRRTDARGRARRRSSEYRRSA
jgi:hypothetical protein